MINEVIGVIFFVGLTIAVTSLMQQHIMLRARVADLENNQLSLIEWMKNVTAAVNDQAEGLTALDARSRGVLEPWKVADDDDGEE